MNLIMIVILNIIGGGILGGILNYLLIRKHPFFICLLLGPIGALLSLLFVFLNQREIFDKIETGEGNILYILLHFAICVLFGIFPTELIFYIKNQLLPESPNSVLFDDTNNTKILKALDADKGKGLMTLSRETGLNKNEIKSMLERLVKEGKARLSSKMIPFRKWKKTTK